MFSEDVYLFGSFLIYFLFSVSFSLIFFILLVVLLC